MSPPSPKPLWTQRDFEAMSWHDNAIHAIALEYTPPWPGRLLLDIDYIVQWDHSADPGGDIHFWVCPATLVFEEASDFRSEIDLSGLAFELSLDAIVRSEPDELSGTTWLLKGHEFHMSVAGPGFKQFLRRAPILSDSQRLSLNARGGLSFDVGD
jgi:hypothetical protein